MPPLLELGAQRDLALQIGDVGTGLDAGGDLAARTAHHRRLELDTEHPATAQHPHPHRLIVGVGGVLPLGGGNGGRVVGHRFRRFSAFTSSVLM